MRTGYEIIFTAFPTRNLLIFFFFQYSVLFVLFLVLDDWKSLFGLCIFYVFWILHVSDTFWASCTHFNPLHKHLLLCVSLNSVLIPNSLLHFCRYCPPELAIANLYWKGWVMLLILSAHNPTTFGNVAWEKYPTLRTLMEMCITK